MSEAAEATRVKRKYVRKEKPVVELAAPIAVVPSGSSPTWTPEELARKKALLDAMRPESASTPSLELGASIVQAAFFESVRALGTENNSLRPGRDKCALAHFAGSEKLPAGVLITPGAGLTNPGGTILVPYNNVKWIEIA